MNLSFTMGKDSITIVLDGELSNVNRSHANWDRLVEQLKLRPEERDTAVISSLLSVKKLLQSYVSGDIAVSEDGVTYKGEAIHGYLQQRMIDFFKEGFDLGPWVQFMEKVLQHPDKSVAGDLFKWMEKAKMPLTPNGNFLAFKKVRSDFTDVHSGKFDNSPGNVVEMDRSLCNTNRNQTCSTGLHFCSHGYLSLFGGAKIVIVEIDPRDVTSIPTDYNLSKGRCCRYVVVDELKNMNVDPALWNKPVADLESPSEMPEILVKATPKKGKKVSQTKAGVTEEALPAKPKKTPVNLKSAPKSKAKKLAAESKVEAEKSKATPKFAANGTDYTAELVASMKADPRSISEKSKVYNIPRSTLLGWFKKV